MKYSDTLGADRVSSLGSPPGRARTDPGRQPRGAPPVIGTAGGLVVDDGALRAATPHNNVLASPGAGRPAPYDRRDRLTDTGVAPSARMGP